MVSEDSLGDRMKGYEGVPRNRLVPKMPVMIRLDGKAFHTFTRGMPRPYHRPFHECMWTAATYLCENIQGCQVAYVQSDEITLLLTDYSSIKTQAWFDYEVQKMASIAASMCTAAFNFALAVNAVGRPGFATFDARVWNLPKEEIVNAFIWRQQDATRNAIQMVGQARFSHKELHGKSCDNIQEMLFKVHGINFNDSPVPQKRGVCVVKETYNVQVKCGTDPDGSEWSDYVRRTRWVADENIPIFTQDRAYIQRFVDVGE
jgi:tRNA(His) 5'-end guanylyltransferase